MHKFLSCIIILNCYSLFLAAQVKLIPDYTGATQYLIPEGWTINTNQQNNVYTWQAEARPGSDDSPGIFIFAIPDNPEANPNLVIQLLQQEDASLKLIDRKDISNNEAHFLLRGSETKVAAFFLRDSGQNLIFISAFGAKEKTYEQLGGEKLLYQALKRENPFSEVGTNAESNVDNPISSNFNTQDKNLQAQLIRNTSQIDRKRLVGEWLQAFSIATGGAYQDVYNGSIQYGERGHGHLLKLNANGTYQITYSYNNFYQGCRNKVEMVEKGNYTLNGTSLLLKNAIYSGFYNVCGKVTQEKNAKGVDRQFELGINTNGDILVIRGTAFEYSINSEMDNQGNTYIQEGFKRVK